MPEPTKESWVVFDTPNDTHIIWAESDTTRDSVAYVVGGEHSKANANLISAAPDLVEALKAVEWHDIGTVTAYRVCTNCAAWESIGHTDDCVVALALAKAKGE